VLLDAFLDEKCAAVDFTFNVEKISGMN